jgi:3-hydroxybutyryl-CoA dehydrogenase
MNLETIAVIGAGVIGVGVAQDLAQSDFRVLLLDTNEEILDRALTEIRQNIRLQTFFIKGPRGPGADQLLARIKPSTDYAVLRDADFVIENVTENWVIKREVYEKLEAICPAGIVFAANTSAITITRIASVTRRPAQVIGIHFMNPVPLKRMVEVIKGFHTNAETIETTRTLLARMNKDFVLVNDAPGFVSNRVLMLTVNEAIFLVQEQVAPPEDVDKLFRECFGHRMGPLETADLIGLDTVLLSIEVLYESFNDDKYRPCPLLRKMVDAGLLGRKSGRGFYHY